MQREAFTKGFENKWMICEDGGIFDGPSGKHSDRIGEVHIGDVIEADAETFDPDNKIIWRLKDPSPGGWIYAPVRGPRTAVPMSQEKLELVAKGLTFYKVTGKKGTIVRAEKELESEQVQIIPKDAVCHVEEEAVLENGKARFRIVSPVQGWITKTQVERTVI